MQVMGVDPFEALVLPRFLALLIIIPLLTFVATLAGLAGGMLVAWSVLDLAPTFFLQRHRRQRRPISHFWIGMSKAPVMAIVIAAIGCRQGMEVGGDVEIARPPGDRGRGARHLLDHPDRCGLRPASTWSSTYERRPTIPRRRATSRSTTTGAADRGARAWSRAFGDNVIHDGLDLTVERGEVLGVVGGSGAGKSVLLNTIIGLQAARRRRRCKVFGQDLRDGLATASWTPSSGAGACCSSRARCSPT